MFNPTSSKKFIKATLTLDDSTYLNVALTKRLFTRPTNTELFIQTGTPNLYILFFDVAYYDVLKSEIRDAYVNGKFKSTSTEKEWNNLKTSIDNAVEVDSIETGNIKPYLSTLIENTTELNRTLTFSSSKISITQGMMDLMPQKADKSYKFQINLSESKTDIIVHDITANQQALINNLENQSIGDGGMILHNNKFMITIEWTKSKMVNITRIIVNYKDKDSRITYFN